MGNECDGIFTKKKGDFQLPHRNINKYRGENSKLSISLKNEIGHIVKILSHTYQNDQLYNLALHINKMSGKSFKDKNFQVLEVENEKYGKSNLHILYNYERLKMKELYTSSKTDCNELKQNQIQLCYLTSVFYLFCVHEQLKQKIILTKRVNLYNCYLFRLFCFGEETIVAVDDSIPTEEENLKYLNVGKQKELWPVLLQKAWCKQIRGYLSAKGLSPEDAFEEITGFPAYSYSLLTQTRTSTLSILQEAIEQKYWIVLTANPQSEKQFKSRQVFYLDHQKDKHFYLRSPYSNIEYQAGSEGVIEMEVEQIMEYFQFITIGFYIKKYKLHSFPLKLTSKKDYLYSISIKQKEEVNIRFIQMFSEYLQGENVFAYDYSSLIFQLYNSRYEIVDGCEGCLKAGEGNRSANISQNLFVTLKPGRYFLRIEVNWVNESVLNEGKLLVYCSEGNFGMQELKEEDLLDVFPRLITNEFENQSNCELLKNKSQGLKVRSIERQYKHLIGVENMLDQESKIKIVFKQSQNIRVKLQNFQIQNGKITVKLTIPAESQQILEIVPLNPRKSMTLKSFDIEKL